ncbi:replicative DNA helicase [Fibrobacterales bacterium]|nr:replicative DNA helicase [Fibrobacterales bacterium]
MPTYSQEYPQAVDAEAWLLGGILHDPKSFGEVSLVLRHGAEFYHEKNQAVWDAMRTLYTEGNPVDVITLSDVLEKRGKLSVIGGKDYLFSLMESVSSAANASYHAEIIRNKFVLRTLISSSNHTIKEAMEPAAEMSEVLQGAEKRIFDIATEQIKENAIPIGEAAEHALNILATRKHNELSGVSTGFQKLNDLTNGLQKSDMIILAARPSMGKTAFALNIAANSAKQGNTVLFFSLEMSADQLAKRILSSESGINQRELNNGFTSNEEHKKLIMKAKELASLPLFIDDSSVVNALDLISKCRVFKRKHDNKLDLVVVDYLQMMKVNSKAENRAVGVGENSRLLKVLAKELQIPVLALAQLNRKVEDRPIGGGYPQLSDLRDSGSIEQDADMVWFIHRPIKDKQKKKGKDSDWQPTQEEEREAHIIIAKHRNGPTKDIRMEFVGETTTFYDYSGVDYAGGGGD